MVLYSLTTAIGAGFMLASGWVLCLYLYYGVYLKTPGAGPEISLVFTLYLIGHALILIRSHLITDVAHRIREHGEPGDAQVLSARLLGRPEEARDRYWYALDLRVQPHRSGADEFETSVTQLFDAHVSPTLEAGVILPVRYITKPVQAVVMSDGALPAIRR